MESEYAILALVQLGLLVFSFFSISICVLRIKNAWIENDQKKMRNGMSLLWGGIIAGCMFLKMFGGIK